MMKRWINTDFLIYIALRFVAMIFQMFPINWNLTTARCMGWIWFHLIKRHRQRAIDHLKLAYGDSLTEAQRHDWALKSMQQMTMVAMETFFVTRLINEWTWPKYITLHNIEPSLNLLTRQRGAIMVTGHYGSWELCGFVLATMGFPIVAVMRPLDNPYINQYLMDVRAKRGLQLLYKKGVTRSADDVLRNNGILAFIADQNAGHKGMFVDFFGQKASTYKSIALLAMQHEVPIIVGYARRLSPRFEYEVGVQRIIEPTEWANQPNELFWITQEFTRAIEDFVRVEPWQYLWMHRRWKSQPKGGATAPLIELPSL